MDTTQKIIKVMDHPSLGEDVMQLAYDNQAPTLQVKVERVAPDASRILLESILIETRIGNGTLDELKGILIGIRDRPTLWDRFKNWLSSLLKRKR